MPTLISRALRAVLHPARRHTRSHIHVATLFVMLVISVVVSGGLAIFGWLNTPGNGRVAAASHDSTPK